MAEEALKTFDRGSRNDGNNGLINAGETLPAFSRNVGTQIDLADQLTNAKEEEQRQTVAFNILVKDIYRSENQHQQTLMALAVRTRETAGAAGLGGLNIYRMKQLEEYFARLARGPPSGFLIGTTAFTVVNDQGDMEPVDLVSINGRSPKEFGEAFITRGDKELK